MKKTSKIASLGTLSSFGIRKKYIYNVSDLKKNSNGIIYEILIDVINSGRKKIPFSQRTTVDPKNVKYFAGIQYNNGSYAIKRNIKSKLDAKHILEKIKYKIDNTIPSERRNLLIAESRKS